MLKERIQLEIIKKSEITKKKRPPALFFLKSGRETFVFFFYLALNYVFSLAYWLTTLSGFACKNNFRRNWACSKTE